MTASIADAIKAHRLRDEIYDAHACGCCWHVVLDDNNVDDSNVEFCMEWAEANTGGGCQTREACTRIGPILMAMSPTQRLKLSNNGYAAAADADRSAR